MLYLALAMTSSMLITVLMRISEKYTRSDIYVLAANYFACTVLGVVFSGGMELLPDVPGLRMTLGLGLMNGALYLGSFMLLKWNISKNGVVLPATFMRLGVLVPTLLSITVFGEEPGIPQILGIAAAIAAIIMMQQRGSGGINSLGGLILLLVGGGSADSMSKVFEETGPALLKDHFLIYTFFAALVMCLILCAYRRQKPGIADICFGALIGIPNYLSTRFLLLSLDDIPAIIAYPTYSAGTIVLVTLVGMVFFRERLSRRRLTALGIILAALVLLNLPDVL